jgi:hypothetical protein
MKITVLWDLKSGADVSKKPVPSSARQKIKEQLLSKSQ